MRWGRQPAIILNLDEKEADRYRRALRVIRSYTDDETASIEARMAMIQHWSDEALAGREVPLEAGIPGPP